MVKNIKEHLKQLKRLGYICVFYCSLLWKVLIAYRPFPHYAPVSKHKEMKTRLGSDNFIQITVLCPPLPGVSAFVYRNVGKVSYYWFTLLNAIIKKNEAHATETKLAFGNSKRRLILRRRLLTSDFSIIFQQIDGEAFLLLNQSDIVNILKIKLGPALKIFNTIPKFWCYLNCN